MSRETNSLLLRYGINTFWSASISLPFLFYTSLQLDGFFSLFFKNYNLQVFKIHYSVQLINIYVFYYKEQSTFLLQTLLTFSKNELQQLHFRKFYGLNYGLQKRKIRIKIKRVNLVFIYVMKLFFLKFFYFFVKKILNCYTYNYLPRDFILIKNFLSRFKIVKKKKKKKKHFLLRFFKLKYLNYLIKFKSLGLVCTFLIAHYTYKTFKVNIRSIFEKALTSLRFPFFFKYLKNYSMKQKLYLVLLSFLFLKANILNFYLNIIIKKTRNKKHVKNLIIFFFNLKILFDKQIVPIFGLKFKIFGRLGGKLRKGSFSYKLGAVRLMSFNLFLDYSCSVVYTQYGTFSLKMWLCSLLEHRHCLK